MYYMNTSFIYSFLGYFGNCLFFFFFLVFDCFCVWFLVCMGEGKARAVIKNVCIYMSTEIFLCFF